MQEDDPGMEGGLSLPDLVTVTGPISNLTSEYFWMVPYDEKVKYDQSMEEFVKLRCVEILINGVIGRGDEGS